ncbi:CoA pyrophosphatase [Rhodovastum atsumiense]|uniref:CoA pyrophosphatase n=1 Tax=Rhodovastum atsumiense TaxID=504468 RepID=UPI001EF0D75E|nr:CoA pyrophosphatase [Rhodovastum atsumiense]CAH2600088.1 CoA pyrophosphatase [Rhodovastum atsumiense]
MDPLTLRKALAERIGRAPPPPIRPASAIAAPVGSDDAADLIDGPPVPAAVLVPLVLGPVPGVLLTKRTAHLAQHAGQVSFPGGRIDPGDASPEAAALREAQEEIGLDPSQVELAGRLGEYVTGTGYAITPVLGLLPVGQGLESLALLPSPAEVDAVFELPMTVLLDPDAPQRRRVHFRGRWREFWVWPHPEHYIWGATAGILVQLATLLRGS